MVLHAWIPFQPETHLEARLGWDPDVPKYLARNIFPIQKNILPDWAQSHNRGTNPGFRWGPQSSGRGALGALAERSLGLYVPGGRSRHPGLGCPGCGWSSKPTCVGLLGEKGLVGRCQLSLEGRMATLVPFWRPLLVFSVPMRFTGQEICIMI